MSRIMSTMLSNSRFMSEFNIRLPSLIFYLSPMAIITPNMVYGFLNILTIVNVVYTINPHLINL
jgi:hypothetical protein